MNKKNLRFLSATSALILTMGCTVKTAERPFCLFVQNKIPLRVVLVIPDEIRQRECKHVAELNFTKYSCGSILYETYVKTMERTFLAVKTVKDISEATQPWDRLLLLELDDFKMIKTTKDIIEVINLNDVFNAFADAMTNKTPIFQVCLSVSSKSIDKENKEIYSSKIACEENLFYYIISQQQAINQHYEQKAFINVVNKVMLKMVEEIMNAYNKGQV